MSRCDGTCASSRDRGRSSSTTVLLSFWKSIEDTFIYGCDIQSGYQIKQRKVFCCCEAQGLHGVVSNGMEGQGSGFGSRWAGPQSISC